MFRVDLYWSENILNVTQCVYNDLCILICAIHDNFWAAHQALSHYGSASAVSIKVFHFDSWLLMHFILRVPAC